MVGATKIGSYVQPQVCFRYDLPDSLS